MGLLKRRAPPRSTIAALLLVAAAISARPAEAQGEADRQRARELGDQGKTALAQKDYAAAADAFRKAAALVAAPTLEIGLARAEVGLGHFVAARKIYAHLAEAPPEPGAPPPFVKASKDAATELVDLDARMPSVIINVRGAPPETAEITIDGAAIPGKEIGVKRSIDPGRHVVHGAAPSAAPADATFTATEGATSEVSLDLTPKPRVSAPARTMVSFGLMGLGVGAIALGGVIGGFALRERSALFAACPDGRCTEPQRGKLESYHRESALAWPMLGAGAASVGAGAALFALSSRAGALVPDKIGPTFVGAGIAGVSLGVVSGIVALGAKPDRARSCAPPTCQDRIDGYHDISKIAIGSLAAGGIAVGAGALLIAWKRDATPPASSAGVTVIPAVGPGSVSLSGRF